MKREHPVFAWIYEAANKPVEWLGASGMHRMRSRLVSRLRGRILEVGVGNGLNLVHYGDGCEVVGIDPDPHMLKRAVPRARAAAGRVLLVAADGEALPFAEESFDAAVSCLVLCTVRDPLHTLGEIRRVLKPGGQLHFVEHVRARPEWLASLQDVIDPAWARMFAGCHLNRDTQIAIEGAGFRIETMSEGAGGVMIRGRAMAA